MAKNRQTAQITRIAIQRVILLAIIYIVLIFLLPASQATMRAYRLSGFEYRITLLAVTLPSMIVWLAAFIGYAKLREYVYFLRKAPEGASFAKLATGCTWLAWSLPVPAIVGFILSAAANKWPGFHHASIITSNYISLLLPLVAFTIIADASRGLVNRAKLKFSVTSVATIMLFFLAAGVLYCYLTFQHFDLTSLNSTDNPYFLPMWLMVISVVIPYLYAWFVGLLSAYEITLFSKHASGVLYRQALRLLVIGFTAIIISSIALQYSGSVYPRVGHLVFNYQLALTSIFRVIGGGGFVLLAIGANRLKKIEEV